MQISVHTDQIDSAALFLYRKLATKPTEPPLVIAGPPIAASDAEMQACCPPAAPTHPCVLPHMPESPESLADYKAMEPHFIAVFAAGCPIHCIKAAPASCERWFLRVWHLFIPLRPLPCMQLLRHEPAMLS